MWVFFPKLSKNIIFVACSAHKNATALVNIRGDRGHAALRIEYKTASEQYLVVLGVLVKIHNFNLKKKKPNIVLLITL